MSLPISDSQTLTNGSRRRNSPALFSHERLERCLLALDMNVTIHVAPKLTTAARGRLAVHIAATV